jgi:glucosamine kinase
MRVHTSGLAGYSERTSRTMEYGSLITPPEIFLPVERLQQRSPTEPGVGAGYFLGVDGGATKTLAIVFELRTYAFTVASAGPSNPDAVGQDAALSAIRDAIEGAVRAAGIRPKEIQAGVLAIAGVDSATDEAQLRQALVGHYLPSEVWIVNDVVAAWAAGTRCEPGIALIAGTGSNAFGVNANGQSWRAGGWGHIIGDEGSAYWIALTGIRAALSCRDGRGPHTVLVDSVSRSFSIPSVDTLPELVYGAGLTKGQLAAFAADVHAAAEKGDSVALEIFKQAGNELYKHVRAIVVQLNLQRDSFPVALAGTVFATSALLRQTVEQRVTQLARLATCHLLKLPPAAGALLMAIRASRQWEALDLELFEQAISQAFASSSIR